MTLPEVSSMLGSHLSLNQGTDLNLSGQEADAECASGCVAPDPHHRAGPAAPQVSPAASHQLTQATRNRALCCGVSEGLTGR